MTGTTVFTKQHAASVRIDKRFQCQKEGSGQSKALSACPGELAVV